MYDLLLLEFDLCTPTFNDVRLVSVHAYIKQ